MPPAGRRNRTKAAFSGGGPVLLGFGRCSGQGRQSIRKQEASDQRPGVRPEARTRGVQRASPPPSRRLPAHRAYFPPRLAPRCCPSPLGCQGNKTQGTKGHPNPTKTTREADGEVETSPAFAIAFGACMPPTAHAARRSRACRGIPLFVNGGACCGWIWI
jgi:hypothetical protein